jgi:predicted transposase YbfD/YdcC
LCALTEAFASLTDPRVNRRRRHLLIDIVVIAVCAVIASAEKWRDIAAWGKSHRQWLGRFLELPNGIPSGDTFRRVICRLDPEEFQRCFLSWAASLVGAAKGRLLNIDGKTLRRSGRLKNEDKPLHIVSVWASEQNLALGQTTVDEKSNEITAIPKLLRFIDLEGALVTIDAMGCQKQIARQIIDGKADYCLAVKGNQKYLEQDIGDHFTRCLDSDFAGVEHQSHTTSEKGHGRCERREYYLTEVPAELRHAEAWAGLKAVGMVANIRDSKGDDGFVRYYICSFNDVERFAAAVRGHWSIENSLHWIMDVTFREDDSRIQNELGASNFSWMRRFAISLLKNESTMKDSVRQKRLLATWDVDYLQKVLLAAIPKTPEN